MHAAFLVIAAKSGGPLLFDQWAAAREPRPNVLAFPPHAHMWWLDDTGTVAVGAWQDEPAQRGTRWDVRDDGVTAAVGSPRWRHRPWSPEAYWAAELSAAAQRDGALASAARDLAGTFAAVAFDGLGNGAIVTDPGGFRCVYHGETDAVFVASSRAELVASVITTDGTPAPRDQIRAAWLAFNDFAVGNRSGFAAVKVLPPQSIIEFRSGHAPSVESTRVSWLPPDSLRVETRDDLVELVRAEIAEGLRSALTLPTEEHVVGLTGGKDSRVLLAVILAEGLRDEFTFETVGLPDLADVVVASRLAERFELRHRVEFPMVARSKAYEECIRDFVATSAGMLNIWDMRDPGPEEPVLHIIGLVGEAFRCFVAPWGQLRTSEQLVEKFTARSRFGRLGLVKPEIAEQCRREALKDLLEDGGCGLPPADVLQTYFLRNRLRFARNGALEELGRQRRSFPFYSIDAIRAALAIGAEARELELLHFEITRRCCDALAKEPFAGPGWLDGLLAMVPNGDAYRSANTPQRSALTPGPIKPTSLMAGLQVSSFDARKDALQDVLFDSGNPAWGVIDRQQAVHALESFSSLSMVERRELYGAVTAALWLDTN